MKLICLDTATDALSCALLVDGDLREHHEVAPRRHAELTLSMVDRLLAEAGVACVQLDAVGFGRGPGSFTGLRIGAGIAQGLAFAADIPVIPVSTLATLAQGALRERGAHRVLAVLDARLGEVYAGSMQADGGGIMRPIRDERRCRPEGLAEDLPEGGWVGSGPGWRVCTGEARGRLRNRLEYLEPERLPRARDGAALALTAWEEGLADPPERAIPVYLRRRVADRAERDGER